MSINTILILLIIGILAGFLSGLVGIGGGIVVVPLLVFLLGFSQHSAQGTTLFLFMIPVGILGVMNYYKSGYVDVKTGLVMACSFVIGSYFGSKLAISLDQALIKKVFGFVLLAVSVKLILGK